MASPKSKESRRFQRAAAKRFEESQFLLHRGGYTTASVYLAGYAVECMLKALILSSEPEARNRATLKSFMDSRAHSFEWLRERLAERRVRLSADAAKNLARVNGWKTALRYDPKEIRRKEADGFLASAEKVTLWIKGRL